MKNKLVIEKFLVFTRLQYMSASPRMEEMAIIDELNIDFCLT